LPRRKHPASIRGVKEFLDGIREVSPHAEPILVISLTAILGLLIGSIRIRGIKLGVAGMLFSGLLLGHFGLTLDPHLMSFLKEFGLALFVFTVGLQLGPGFFNSLKKDGLKLNALALLIVLGGAAVVFMFGALVLKWDPGVLAGVFSGATTNTPSLGAAQQAMAGSGHADSTAKAAMAYAVAYPFGVLGIILVIILIRVVPHRSEKGTARTPTTTLPRHPRTPARIAVCRKPQSRWRGDPSHPRSRRRRSGRFPHPPPR
jgi:putative transport protein